MGVGDALMATGEVRELRENNSSTKFIIGDGNRSYWNDVFNYNPYIIRGSEINNHKKVIWIKNYEGNRPYRNYGDHLSKDKYNWKKNFKPKKGEFFFSEIENSIAKKTISTIKRKIGQKKIIFIEPHIKKRLGYENRDWGLDKWQTVVSELSNYYAFIQVTYEDRETIKGCININGLNFRSSAAILAKCDLFIGPEGGMHHAAAATDRKAVVIFGGHISPNITGYNNHKNLYIDHPMSPCGNKYFCKHCQECLDKIKTENMVYEIKKII